MFITKVKNDNLIFHFFPLEKIAINSVIDFKGRGNILFLAPNAILENTKIDFCGDFGVCFNNSCLRAKVMIFHHCGLFIGSRNYFNEWGNCDICVSEAQNIIIGEECYFSHDLYFRTCDAHPLYSFSGERLNSGKSIFVGDNVWLGAFCKIIKGAFFGSGVILGNSSLALNGKYFSNCAYGGHPAKLLRREVFWGKICTHGHFKAEAQKFNGNKEDQIYSEVNANNIDPFALDLALKNAAPLDKIALFYDLVYNNSYSNTKDTKNRFAILEQQNLAILNNSYNNLAQDSMKQDSKKIAQSGAFAELLAGLNSNNGSLSFNTKAQEAQNGGGPPAK